jgi:Cys-rich protein (TIGR01571 family)
LLDTPVPETMVQESQHLALKSFDTPVPENMVQESQHLALKSQEFAPQPRTDHDQQYYDVPMVDVVSPADLPGGYHFEAEIEGQRFLATVPPGGVQQGETFTCYMRELDSVAIDIPVGYWKDGLFNMCELGWCHPIAWISIFCPLVALGQVQTRISLDFLGRPSFGDLPTTNRFMMLTVIMFWAMTNVGLFAACNLKWSRGLELSVADVCAFALVNVAMFCFIVFVTQSTRSSLREKFMIREERCFDLEDICCAAVCLPCTVGQMARHTANYDDYEAVCCSKTGLPNGVRVNQDPTKESDGYIA